MVKASRRRGEGAVTTTKTELMELEKAFHQAHEGGRLSTPPDQAIAFINAFIEKDHRAHNTSTFADPATLKVLMAQYQVQPGDCWRIPHLMLLGLSPDLQYRGKRLYLAMSRAGVEEATIRIMAQVVKEAVHKPAKLHAAELRYARAHLTQMANEGRNYRAMVCEGKVARATGDIDRAIQLWRDAVQPAIVGANQTAWDYSPQRDDLELTSPWIELMLATKNRVDLLDICEWAMDIGCQQDDPVSHYHMSTVCKKIDDEGNHDADGKWLYHCTKAAASGHPAAAYDLARFYAESGWKYISDEPPDHLKPTPFDSYPAPNPPTFWDFICGLFRPRERAPKPEETIILTAIYPQTADKRLSIAFFWLEVAMDTYYAPAYLFGAQLVSTKTLWGNANAPASALDLTPERYTYASKEDYEAGRPIPREPVPEPPDIPNPHYNIRMAKELLREVFHAHESFSYADQVKRSYQLKRRKHNFPEVPDDAIFMDPHLYYNMGMDVTCWFGDPDTREMYTPLIDDMYREAMAMCDENDWDIYDRHNSLIYRAKSGRRRQVKWVGQSHW